MNLLIIEDNFSHYNLLKRYIIDSNLLESPHIEHADSLEEGIIKLRETTYDLIFTDLFLPDSDNLDNINRILEINNGAPLIVITSHEVEELGIEAIRRGAIDFVCKDNLDSIHIRTIIRFALERQKIRKKIIDAGIEAQRVAAMKASFLANMSHEIRTPLNLIVGAANLLSETPLTPQQKKYVDTFSRASDHLLTLLDNVLDISRIEAKGLDCVEEGVDLNEVGIEVCELINVLCRQKKLEFDYLIESSGKATKVLGDKVRIKQVMLNLLNNALKFTEKGSIKLELKSKEIENESVSVQLKVSDTGMGVSEEDKNQIFDVFFQADAGLTRSFKGTGLGLAIVKAIAEYYQGNIEFESQPNAGTQIIVNLILKIDPDAYERPKYLNHLRVLMIAGDTMERKTNSQQMKSDGISIRAVEAWETDTSLKLREFDFVILDVQNKFQNVFHLLKTPSFQHSLEKVILLMPPIPRATDLEECERLHIKNFIYKPFTLDKLESIILQIKPEDLKRKKKEQGLNLLIVDDDDDNRDLVKAYLTKSPFQTDFAKNGFEAIEKVKNQDFDIILMDIEMPQLNGYDTALKILEIPNKNKIKILGLSANAFTENLEQAKSCGFSGYVTKPIKKDTLIHAISECQSGKKIFGNSQKH